MSEFNKLEKNAAKTAAQMTALEELDPEMRGALKDFKASLHAWSDAAMSGPRAVTVSVVRHTWRFAVAWAMAAALMLAGVSGGFYVHHRNEVEKQIALQQQKEEQERQLALQREQQEERLLANVDRDLSRQVPEAMEPLAQLMDESQSQ